MFWMLTHCIHLSFWSTKEYKIKFPKIKTQLCIMCVFCQLTTHTFHFQFLPKMQSHSRQFSSHRHTRFTCCPCDNVFRQSIDTLTVTPSNFKYNKHCNYDCVELWNNMCNSVERGAEADSGGETELSRFSSTSLDSQLNHRQSRDTRHKKQRVREISSCIAWGG